MSAFPAVSHRYLDRIAALMERSDRCILGLVGPPGAGKSTVAQVLAQHFPGLAQVVPMDGFHLANVELARLGRSARKGAPDTFDALGYQALLHRLRTRQADEIVYAPEFRRDLEEPVAGAIAVLPSTRLVITEGNYLLLDQGGWSGVARLLDEAWYVEVADTLRQQRLIARHVQFGRTPDEARAWVAATDEPNAQLIATTRERASCLLEWQ